MDFSTVSCFSPFLLQNYIFINLLQTPFFKLFYWRIIALQNFVVFCQTSIWISHQFSYSVVSDSLRPHELQHARPPCPSPTPGVHSNSHPSSWWCHPAISSCHPLLLLPPIPPSISLFQWVNSSHEVAKVLEFQL